MVTVSCVRSVLVALAFASIPVHLYAAPQDYRFEVVQPQIKRGASALIDVRVVHVPTGKAVQDAVIFRTRLDMTPGGMPGMVAPTTPVESGQPGVFRFRTGDLMEGDWALGLSAKVPGEVDTVAGSVRIKSVR